MGVKELTIVILTNRNDDRFLDSLKSSQFANEIIIIDNNSENDWDKLKQKYSFKVLKYLENINNFSKVKNNVLENVKTNWVLFLDSDETLPESTEQSVQDLIDNNLYDAISIKRTDYFLGKPLNYGEAGNINLIRMFKTQNGRFKRNVHEVVDYKGKLGEANFVISHFSHKSIKDFLEKITKYSQMDIENKNLNKQQIIFQMMVYPVGKFIYNYFFKLGFLDGYRGIMYAVLMSLHSFYVRVFYYENL